MAIATQQAQALFRNVTLDDFDAVFRYSSDKDFNTNDPSKANPAYAVFHDGTAHFTSTPGAFVNLTFYGSAVYLYGAAGPSYGTYSVDLDGQRTVATGSALQNSTAPYLLYSATDLNYSQAHSLSLVNLGAANATEGGEMLFDFARLTVPLAAEGATLTNTTVENDNTNLTYTGHWDSNSSPVFSGGTTSYTNASGASVTLSFFGSAIYVFGDANNDHYAFNVTLDGTTTTHHTPLGCGGEFEPHACEKLLPGLQYFAGPLNESQHTITVTNYVQSPLNYSYFDLDRFVYTTPSAYLNLSLVPAAGSAAGAQSAANASTIASTNGAQSRMQGLSGFAVFALLAAAVILPL